MAFISLKILLSILGGLAILLIVAAVFWFFPVKLWSRFRRETHGPRPCPFKLGWVLDLKFRRWCYRHVLDKLPLTPGATVLDIGAGTGTFTIPMARRLSPNGEVIAVDIQPEMIAELNKRVAEAGLTNVKTHVCGADALSIADESVDCAIFIGVLGEVPDQQKALCDVHRVLKSGGVVSITETFVDPDYNWPNELKRMLTAAGFTIQEKFGGFWLHTTIARKD